MKKVIFSVLLGLVAFISMGCVFVGNSNTKVIEGSVVFENQTKEKNGSTNIDPLKVSYIDVKFEEPMDTSVRVDFIYYNNESYNHITNYGWKNSYTIRFYVNLTYDTDYKIVLNDDDYLNSTTNDGTYSKVNSYVRDKNGNYLKSLPIEFSTKRSPNIGKPQNYVLDVPRYVFEFGDNRKNAENMQACFVSCGSEFNHDKLRKGDSITFNFKFKSEIDIPEIYGQMADVSPSVHYWLRLDEPEFDAEKKETYHVVVKDMKASTKDSENVYEGLFTFIITENAVSSEVGVQLFAPYNPEDKTMDKLYSVESLGVIK